MARQLAGSVLVVLLAAGVLGFVLVLRAQQNGLGATMAAAHIRAVSPPDGATNVPVSGEIRAEYISRPSQDPAIRLEPPAGSSSGRSRWDGSTFVLPYSGLHSDSLYHVELDQDASSTKGEHQQIKVRWSFRTGSVATPTPTPTSSAKPTISITATPTPPPTSPPPALIWYRGSASGLDYGVDWSGTERKTIDITNVLQSPNGAKLWQRRTGVVDSSGQPAGTVAVDQSMMWSDDSQQFCGISGSPSLAYQLELLTLDGNRHRVGPIALPTANQQAVTPILVACSTLTGRAVVAGQQGGSIWNMAMISLTDGTVIYQRTYPNPVARIVASHDGRYLAEQLPSGGPFTIIRELPSGNQIGQLAEVAVQAFSWDGSLVGVSTGAVPGTAPQAIVMRWQTHQTLWHLCTCPSPASVSVLPEPGGTKLAIIAGWNNQTSWSFIIVDADGTTKWVTLASTLAYPAF
ncbi:MAG TPA: Ig-like domain-containing protein [Candidatus Dormibacteraeota bacterium]|nr:Ig-like domain-containing protein [Candidatus Dormibacteraeota bacterium]